MIKKTVRLISVILALSLCAFAPMTARAAADDAQVNVRLFYHGEIDATMAKNNIDYNDNKIANAHRENSGVNVTFQPGLADTTEESQKRAMILASGDVPDLMDISRIDYFKYAAQGVFTDVRPMLADMPDYVALVDKFGGEEILGAASFKNTLYCFPSILEESDLQRTDSGGLMVRKDVRESLGIAVPTTLDEVYDMLVKVKDETGMIPLTGAGSGSNYNNAFFRAAFRVNLDYVQDGDTLRYIYAEPAFKDYITYMNKLYTEKLLDEEYITLNSNDMTERFLGNKAFGATQGWSYACVNIRDIGQKIDGAVMEFLPHVGIGDEKPQMHNNSPVQRYWVIPSAAKNKEGAAKFMNYMATPESKRIQDYGIEGEDYTLNGDTIEQTTEQQMNVTWKICYEVMATPDSFKVRLVAKGYDWAYNESLEGQKGADIVTNLLELLPPDDAFQRVKTELSLDTFIAEQLSNFIIGRRSLDEYDSFIDELNGMGLDMQTEALNTWYQANK